ncbi:MAG: hypothetical protein RJB26_2073 [Pseudomonadota bacterium]|jgi:uncharacterized protein YgfB (UPF0149 family)
MASIAPFNHLDRSFAAAGSPVDAAEAHGCLAGSLCAVAAYRFEHWLAEVMPEDEDADEDSGPALVALLESVFHDTSQALGGQSMEFAPLLPDDETPLPQRVRALISWCTGFLYGLGAGGLPSPDRIPGEVGEVLKDFTELTRASDLEPTVEEQESAEADYAELVEYVRAGTQLVFEELAPLRERALGLSAAGATPRH